MVYVNLQWNGNRETLIRKEANGEKFEIKPGESLEVEMVLAQKYCKTSKDFEIIGADTKKTTSKKPAKASKKAKESEDKKPEESEEPSEEGGSDDDSEEEEEADAEEPESEE